MKTVLQSVCCFFPIFILLKLRRAMEQSVVVYVEFPDTNKQFSIGVPPIVTVDAMKEEMEQKYARMFHTDITVHQILAKNRYLLEGTDRVGKILRDYDVVFAYTRTK